ncbi:hypothetical protein GTA08_BOTSDO06109 [Neofusicoccum parvum]|nr:hypothetical protein GTA08_BOTSDO06109 [Neofusicoccum parvum]
MKTTAIFASALACAGGALAAEDTFKLIATGSGSSIDGKYLKVNAGFFYIGKETNSTCGDIAPVFEGGNEGWLAMYANGEQNQQQVYADISGATDGLLSYTGPIVEATNPDHVTDQFSRAADGKLSYADSNWLACPQATGEYLVYPEKAYGSPVGKDKCTAFEITTKKVRTPKVVCVYQ